MNKRRENRRGEFIGHPSQDTKQFGTRAGHSDRKDADALSRHGREGQTGRTPICDRMGRYDLPTPRPIAPPCPHLTLHHRPLLPPGPDGNPHRRATRPPFPAAPDALPAPPPLQLLPQPQRLSERCCRRHIRLERPVRHPGDAEKAGVDEEVWREGARAGRNAGAMRGKFRGWRVDLCVRGE